VLLFLAIAGAYVALQAAPMATYFLARRHPWLPSAQTGVLLVVVGGASVALAFLRLVDVEVPDSPLVGLLTTLPPGEWARDAYHGDVVAVVLMLLFAAVPLTATIHMSGDAYPELWESSSRLFTLRRLARERGGQLRPSDVRRAFGQYRRRRVVSASDAWVPAGAGAILWKEWLALCRTPAGLLLQVTLTAGALVAGIIVGLLVVAGEPGLASSLASLGAAAVLMVNVYSGLRLGAELRNPVWWLSADGLRERLLTWTVAGTLRQAIPALVGSVTALAIIGDPGLLLAAVVAVPLATWVLRMVALASYALVPSQLDLRGPGRVLRMLLFVVTVVPPAFAVVIAWFVTGSLAAGVVVASALLLGEGWLLLELAAWLVRRNGVGYVRAEAS
jgi:Putative ABC exporter